jgi:hypothetical protein
MGEKEILWQELTGGGLIPLAGRWRAMRAAHQAGLGLTSDEPILGSSSFVEKTLASVPAKITTDG